LLGIVVGYLVALAQGQIDFSPVGEAGLFGLPPFHAPEFHWDVLFLFLPVVLVLVAENIGHVKTVGLMTNRNLDASNGRALMADGLSTTLSGLGGGVGTTTYAENIGVMAATRVYSSAAYYLAAATAFILSMSPKFGQLIDTVPLGVLGGAATVLYGMIGILGARIWVQNRVDFSDPINLTTAGVALIIGIANYTWVVGELRFEGIALGTAAALGVYHLMRVIAKWRGTSAEAATPATVPSPSEEHDQAD